MTNLIAGLQRLRDHFNNPDTGHVVAEHNYIKVYPTDIPMTQWAVEQMKSHGWVQDGGVKMPYNPEGSWYLWA